MREQPRSTPGKVRTIPADSLFSWVPAFRFAVRTLRDHAVTLERKGGWTDAELRREEARELEKLITWVDRGCKGPAPKPRKENDVI